jgi:hypothetical protein
LLNCHRNDARTVENGLVSRSGVSKSAKVVLSPVGVRQRRWRLRQNPPARAVYLVEVERDAVRQALIKRSDLSANEIAGGDCIGRALSGVIAQWVEHERRQHHP